MKSLPVVLLLLVIAPGSASAQAGEAVGEPAAASAVGVAQGEEPPEDEIIVEGEVPKERRRVCEVQTATGSIMPKRICRTVAQIEEDERVARESLEIIKRDRDTRSFVQVSREQGP